MGNIIKSLTQKLITIKSQIIIKFIIASRDMFDVKLFFIALLYKIFSRFDYYTTSINRVKIMFTLDSLVFLLLFSPFMQCNNLEVKQDDEPENSLISILIWFSLPLVIRYICVCVCEYSINLQNINYQYNILNKYKMKM